MTYVDVTHWLFMEMINKSVCIRQLHPATGCVRRCSTPEKDAASNLPCRHINGTYLLFHPYTDHACHRWPDVRMRRRPAYNQNHNVLAIRDYLRAAADTKNTNFLIILQFIRQFFVPLRPRNFAHWSTDRFGGYFLGYQALKNHRLRAPNTKFDKR